MAKTPRTRHSKSSREPVTIDLEAEPVHREPTPMEEVSSGGESASSEEFSGQDPVDQASSNMTGIGADESAREEAQPAMEAGSDSVSQSQPQEDEPLQPDEARADMEAPAEEPASEEQTRAPVRSRGGFANAFVGGLLGALIMLLIGGALLWTGVLPGTRQQQADPAMSNLEQQVAALQNEISQLRENAAAGPSAEALQQALAEPRQQISELRDTVAALQSAPPAENGAELQRLGQQLAELENRVASVAQTAGTGDTSQLSQQVSELEMRVAGAMEAANTAQERGAATAQQVNELARQVTQLSEQVAKEDEGPRLALIVAASALRSAVERGAPFGSELDTYSAIAPNAPELDPLRPYAQTGIPTEAALVSEAPQIASRIAASSSDLPPDAGVFDRLMASARSAVTVRPVGEVPGDTPEAIAARMEAAVKRGDYAQALSEYDSLPPSAKDVAAEFAEKLRARRAADQVLEKALSNALKPA
ncbi:MULTISPECIES: phage tail protein [Chelativorans]|jgi:hypothetical protein|uniref:Putative phage tail protein n=1 Tax=Chelativorans sp. (strain BNC1) TaxID=266779 RepID=Q11DF3_CHESB|nr:MULTISPECIES: phage tail protein [Chelativorans]